MSLRPRQTIHRLLGTSAAIMIAVGVTACAASTPQPPSEPQPDSFQQMLAAHARCLQDRGWVDAAYDDTSSLTVSVPAGQEEQYSKDSSDCKQEIGFKQVESSVGLSTKSLTRLYELEVETARCLSDLGYETDQPPSRQSFIDDYQSGKGGWIAYGQLPEMGQEEFAAMSEQCPQAATTYGEELWNQTYGKK